MKEAQRDDSQFGMEYVQALMQLRRSEVAIRGLLLVDGLDEPAPPPSQGQPRRQDDQRLRQELQESIIGPQGRALEDRLGGQSSQK